VWGTRRFEANVSSTIAREAHRQVRFGYVRQAFGVGTFLGVGGPCFGGFRGCFGLIPPAERE
jgi:hypothetical protein